MQKILKNLGQGFTIGLGIVLAVLLGGISYATWLDLTDVGVGNPLTADMFNKVLENQRDLDARFTPESWINATLQNGWVGNSVSGYAYDVPGYYKDGNGRVWLRGALGGGALGTSCAFTLPNGYRPAVPSTGVSSAWSSGNDANVTRVAISTSGCVMIYQQSNMDINTNMVLDGISFSIY